jgi:hypothetical protein
MFLIESCNSDETQVNRAVYYWKTTFDISDSSYNFLEKNNIQKLYIRMFDIKWDVSSGISKPVGEIQFKNIPKFGLNVIPVIYITNKALLEAKLSEIDQLSVNIYNEVKYISKEGKFQFTELQIDCDWTKTTQKKYFKLLNILKKEVAHKNIILSATIRLHQVKYATTTGVPPVSKGMIMFYNMGRIESDEVSNSIFSESEAMQYIRYLNNYPLHLDVVLPCFSWGIQIRSGSVVELLNNWDYTYFENNNNFEAQNSFFYKGFYFKQKDQVRIEIADLKVCQKSAELLVKYLSKENRTIGIFDFANNKRIEYEKNDINKIYNCFK